MKTNNNNKNKLTDTEDWLVITREEWSGKVGKEGDQY